MYRLHYGWKYKSYRVQVGKSEESIKGLTKLLQRADLWYFGKLLGGIS